MTWVYGTTEGEREKGREKERKGERKGEREREREKGRKGEREKGREKGRKGGRKGESCRTTTWVYRSTYCSSRIVGRLPVDFIVLGRSGGLGGAHALALVEHVPPLSLF